MSSAQFRVDPRLASLLGESYRSVTQALRELVDNAWDADSQTVRITLPDLLSNEPLVIEDDGCGMTEEQLRREYLMIASDRRSRRGERTELLNRPVRGRKGIGKFAGLVVASDMIVETRRDSKLCRLHVSKELLTESKGDLERIDLPLEVSKCSDSEHGTTLVLSGINGRFSLPQPETLKERLALEYGRLENFSLSVNNEPLSHSDIKGETYSTTIELPMAGRVSLRYTLLSDPKGVKQSGIVTRVGGKSIGNPTLFGIEDDDQVPRKLWTRIVGEIEADGIQDEDITSDWGSLFDDSRVVQEIKDWAKSRLTTSLNETFTKEVSVAKARRQKEINEALSRLPENRRHFATKHLDRALRRFYGESEERIDVVVSLILDAFEKDEYWLVCKQIDKARDSEIAVFAEALQDFGLVDMACMIRQAQRRLAFLDDLETLARKAETLEAEMHTALENNLWVFGPGYSLMSSNRTLKQTIESYTNSKYHGSRAKKRPDLFLSQNVLQEYLLIEFKRPSHALTRSDESQAESYRDDLTPKFGRMSILVVGNKASSAIQSQYNRDDVLLLGYEGVISTARTQLQWLIRELNVN
ncbi:MAG TPA: ATP-binding protein [Pirellulaceae bacterium]|jgi:hypothetical protein|nr:ATP-binding protein [Pirellulaceae bacterium]